MRPLQGIRILDLSRLLPGPYATWVLASMGAEVLRVEAPGNGDYTRAMPPYVRGTSALFHVINRGKRSIVVDLKAEAGQAIVHKLVAEVDVVFEGFRPGVLERLGLGFDVLKAIKPDIVLCSLTGYGQTGPLAQAAGHDLNYQALAGTLWMAGLPGGRPPNPAFPTADLAASMTAISAILGALFQRERTGEGAHLDISMTESVGAMAAPFLGAWTADANPPGRGEPVLGGGIAQYRTYTCSDGKHLAVGALEPKFFGKFAVALGHPEWLSVPPFCGDHQAALHSEIEAVVITQARDHWAALLEPLDCCISPVLDPGEALDRGHFEARGLLGQADAARWVETPLGEEITDPAPSAGEHTVEVLEELGFSSVEIDGLLQSGTVEKA